MSSPAPTPENFPHVARAKNEREMDVFELAERVNKGDAPFVLDVREPHEFEIARVDFSTEIPMSKFEENWLEALKDKENDEVVIMCRSGGRSAQVQAFLQSKGFTNTRNLVGGILAWAEAIDRTMQQY